LGVRKLLDPYIYINASALAAMSHVCRSL